MTGCLSAACHGGPATATLTGKFDADSWQSSGTCWAARDPHVKAYAALEGELAREIMARYDPGRTATGDARCLACHANPALAAEERYSQMRREGVSCEACHGNAGGWLREHTTWGKNPTADHTAAGMTNLADVGERAMTCLGCHVGAPADPARGLPVRDMNHDMIAAGHPRLNFDFAEYHRRLPKHWQEEAEPMKSEPRVWLVGRTAHAEAACRLLADRAERAGQNDPRTPWPEFAEYNCAACHHTIPQPWRSDPARPGGRPPGSLEWQTIWPVTGTPSAPSNVESLRKLQAVIQGPRPAGYAKVTRPAREAAEKLKQSRESLAGSANGPLLEAAKSAFSGSLPEQPDWDFAGQVLLGLAAMERGRAADPAGFDRAFDAVLQRKWPDARTAIDVLLGRPKQ
jgi:hypothetical protein